MTRILALALVLALAPIASARGDGWRPVAAAPIAPSGYLASAWTGEELVVFGRTRVGGRSRNVAAAYTPRTGRWRRLAPPAGPAGSYEGTYSATWTGEEVLLWGAFDYEAYNPRTNQWRLLPRRPGIGHAGGLVAWTGKELIGWGGGCCGDAFSDGVAYDPATNRWRNLSRAPLAGSQHPLGAWTGRELLVFVAGLDPDGKPWPAQLARAAAYDPTRNTWRRLAAPPVSPAGATATWDGRELLLAGRANAYAFDPAANRWRRLHPPPSHRGATAVWSGKRLFLVGGPGPVRAYDPAADRWSTLPAAPLSERVNPVAAWTGRALLVWGGYSGTASPPRRDGAVFTPSS